VHKIPPMKPFLQEKFGRGKRRKPGFFGKKA